LVKTNGRKAIKTRMADWDVSTLDADLEAFLKANRESNDVFDFMGEGIGGAMGVADPGVTRRSSCRFVEVNDRRRVVNRPGGAIPSTIAQPPGADPASPTMDGLEAVNCPSHMGWRRHFTGILHRIFRYFQRQGHLVVDQATWQHFGSMVPVEWRETHLLATIVATIHACAEMPEFNWVLHEWAIDSGRRLPPPVAVNNDTPRQNPPWEMQYWETGDWSVIAKIINRFSLQKMPGREDDFLESLVGHGFHFVASQFTLELVTGVLGFIYENKGVWGILYPGPPPDVEGSASKNV